MSPAVLNFRRQELETRIEEMIALLDMLDGDPDLEPSFGQAYGDDREDESELLEDTGDVELNGDELDFSGYAGEFH